LSYAGFSAGKLPSLLEVNSAVKLYMNDTVVFVRLLNWCLMIHSRKVNKQYTNITFPSSAMRNSILFFASCLIKTPIYITSSRS